MGISRPVSATGAECRRSGAGGWATGFAGRLTGGPMRWDAVAEYRAVIVRASNEFDARRLMVRRPGSSGLRPLSAPPVPKDADLVRPTPLHGLSGKRAPRFGFRSSLDDDVDPLDPQHQHCGDPKRWALLGGRHQHADPERVLELGDELLGAPCGSGNTPRSATTFGHDGNARPRAVSPRARSAADSGAPDHRRRAPRHPGRSPTTAWIPRR